MVKKISANQLDELKNGNSQVFELIFSTYWEQLFAAAYRRLQDEQQAQDIVQDVLIHLWDKKAVLNLKEEHFEYYLLKAVKNRVINYYQSEKVKEAVFLTEIKRFEGLEQEGVSQPVYKELEAYLSAEIEKLPVTMKKIYLLKERELSVRDIAASLNLAEQTVRNNITEAQVRLRKAVRSKFRAEYLVLLPILYLLTDI